MLKFIRRICKHVPGAADSAANSAETVQAQITDITEKMTRKRRRSYLYLLRSLLRTLILRIHMVFWLVRASLVPFLLPRHGFRIC